MGRKRMSTLARHVKQEGNVLLESGIYWRGLYVN